MPHPSAPAHSVPDPAADPLFADTLRAAVELYIRGDYAGASRFFLDAAAVGQARPDWDVWFAAGQALDAMLRHRALVSVDSRIPREAQVRR